MSEQQPWPAGVRHRFGTLLGAHVDLYSHPREDHMARTTQSAQAKCTGCGDAHSHDTLGRVRDWAQAHAAMCRGLPKPEVQA